MNLRRFRALRTAGVNTAEIARVTGHDRKTVRKYLAADARAIPPSAPPRRGSQPRKMDALAPVVEAWLRRDIGLKASVIHERLVAEHGFTGHYQRVKMHVAEVRPRLAAELGLVTGSLAGLHRRFEVTPGAQAQVDWGDEGGVLAAVGIPKVYSFHLTLSYSRDSFCAFTTSVDLATFWDCHRRAFSYFGGVPAAVVYDRTKTVVARHVAPGLAVPLHPAAAAFAEHYGFAIDVLAAYRPTGKGRVERDVAIVRDHVLAGRDFDSVAELDAAWAAWTPIRRASVHRTHGEVIAVRSAADRAALAPLPARPYLVTDAHLRRVGKDCLVSFEASVYSVPAGVVRAGQRVELRVSRDEVAIHPLSSEPGSHRRTPDGTPLAVHPRASRRGCWVIDPAHWDGLPDGTGRSTVAAGAAPPPRPSEVAALDPLAALLARNVRAAVVVARRPLASYAAAAGLPTSEVAS